MGSKQLPVYVQDILNSVAKEQSFVSYSVDSKSGSQAGDGFVSELFSITIAEDDSEKRLNLMCKLAHSNRDHRKTICSDLLFDREAAFYDKLMPIFANFQAIKNVPREYQFLAYPTCYAAIANEDSERFAIILEDLRPLGFKMWNKTKSSPIENVLLVMREMGKYHGLSLALKDQQPNEFARFENVKETMKLALIADSWQTLFKASFDRAIKTLKNEEYKDIMQHIKDNYYAYIDSCIGDDTAGSFGVLSHGDLWNNNILYRFNEKGIAEDVRFLDFQQIFHASPATDVLYHIFLSTDKALRDKEYDNMLKCYYESLSTTVKLLGSNPDELFTFENLNDELRRCGNYVLIVLSIMTEVQKADSSEVSNLDEVFDKDSEGEMKDLITGLSEKGQREYERHLNEVFDDVVRLGYYNKVK